MSSGYRFLIRAGLSLAFALFVGYFYFGRVDPVNVLVLAGFMVFVAYVFESFRRRKD